jgi:hypothetical protein
VWLELTRTDDAQQCPDADRVWQSVNTLFPGKHVHASADSKRSNERVSISVSHKLEGYEAIFSIESEPGAESHLVDPDEQCQGLADALAVALILRLDPEREREPKRATESRQVSPPPRPEVAFEQPRVTWLAAEGSAIAGAGLLSDLAQPSFGTAFGFAVNRQGIGLRARALRLISTPTLVSGGSVHVDLWAALLGPCWRFTLSRRWALDPCLELGLGRQHGIAQDFPVHREASATWLGIAPTITLSAEVSGPLRATLAAGGVALVRGQRYAVDGRVVAEQPPFGLLISLGLSVGWNIRSGQ